MARSRSRQRQIDEQLVGSPGDDLRATVRDMLKMVHTGLPGRVVSFNATLQTAKVQPSIKRLWIVDDGEDEAIALPECVDVPVHFPGGGGYVLTFPVAAGDYCLLVFAERAIDFWWEKGGVQVPSEERMHDLSDAFAFVGFRPKPGVTGGAVTNFATGRAELRNQAGDVVVAIDGTSAYLGGVAGAQPTQLGTTQNALLDAFLTVASTGPVTNPGQAVAYCVALMAAAVTAKAALSTTLATKAKVL